MFSEFPVKKLSAQMTWAPSLINRSHKWLQRKPAPPVTRTRLFLKFFTWAQLNHTRRRHCERSEAIRSSGKSARDFLSWRFSNREQQIASPRPSALLAMTAVGVIANEVKQSAVLV